MVCLKVILSFRLPPSGLLLCQNVGVFVLSVLKTLGQILALIFLKRLNSSSRDYRRLYLSLQALKPMLLAEEAHRLQRNDTTKKHGVWPKKLKFYGFFRMAKTPRCFIDVETPRKPRETNGRPARERSFETCSGKRSSSDVGASQHWVLG